MFCLPDCLSGVDKIEAAKSKGTHWSAKLSLVASNKILVVAECLEMPNLNAMEVFTEGEPKEIDNPIFGGTGKVNQSYHDIFWVH